MRACVCDEYTYLLAPSDKLHKPLSLSSISVLSFSETSTAYSFRAREEHFFVLIFLSFVMNLVVPIHSPKVSPFQAN